MAAGVCYPLTTATGAGPKAEIKSRGFQSGSTWWSAFRTSCNTVPYDTASAKLCRDFVVYLFCTTLLSSFYNRMTTPKKQLILVFFDPPLEHTLSLLIFPISYHIYYIIHSYIYWIFLYTLISTAYLSIALLSSRYCDVAQTTALAFTSLSL